MVLGSPQETDGLIRILRSEANKLQSGAVERLQALLQKEREITRKIDNAVEAVLGGRSSPAVQKKLQQLEAEKAAIQLDLRALKASVDATTIPEQRLREILATIISSANNDAALLEALVYRVEVGRVEITVWTLLDTDPTGHIDHNTDGVTISLGVPSGVPTVIVTVDFIKVSVPREEQPYP